MSSQQGVAGQWAGNLQIGGFEFSMDPKNMPLLQVFNNVNQHLPSLKLVIKDVSATLWNKVGIGDGTPISLQMGDGKGNTTPTMNFKVIGDPESKPTAMGEEFTISGVLDNVAWLRKVATGAFKGTSGNVIQQLAGQAGLQAVIDSSSDAMTWLTNNKTLAGMAAHVRSRAWASSTSGFILGVRDDKKAIFRNVDNILSGGLGAIFGETGIPVLDNKIKGKATMANNVAGYGATSIAIDPAKAFQEFNKVATTLINGRTGISSEIQGVVGSLGGRVFQQILNSGNVHEKFYEALHQNKRVLSTFARDVDVLVDQLSGVNLLDNALLDLRSNSYNKLDRVNGRYAISAFNRVIQGNRYMERLTLTSQ